MQARPYRERGAEVAAGEGKNSPIGRDVKLVRNQQSGCAIMQSSVYIEDMSYYLTYGEVYNFVNSIIMKSRMHTHIQESP